MNPNELVRIELALALANGPTVDLADHARIYGLSEDVARHDGRILADKAPGLSMAAAPLVRLAGPMVPSTPGTDAPSYWALRHLLTALLVAGTTTGICFLLVASMTDLKLENPSAIAVIGALSTPLWTYGTVFFGHAPAAVLVTIAWVLLLRPLSDSALRPWPALVGGITAGAAVATEYPTMLLIAVIFGTLFARRPNAAILGTACCGLVIGLAPALVYHHAAFGSPWLTGYSFKADPDFADIHTTGLVGVAFPTFESLWGVLLGSSRGLLNFAPILVLAPVGLYLIHRRRGWAESAPLAAASVVYVGFAAGFVDWQAGWGAASRHLVPLLPVLLIPTFAVLGELRHRPRLLLVAAALAALSVARGLLTLIVTPFFPPEFDQPLRQLVLPSVMDGAAAPNLVTAMTGIPPTVVWSVVAAATVSLVAWAMVRIGRNSAVPVVTVVVIFFVGQLGWLTWRSTNRDPELELYRSQVLERLGHFAAAQRAVPGPHAGAEPR
ncbi:MAG: hypothetical protein V2I67_15185 [Thermoanaerobaculales bacterium]|nr:hypothetical protein [Thermoanaerobaculales bacterium]